MPENTNIPQSLPLTLIRVTEKVIHFGWEPLAEDDPDNPIVYQVWITEEEDPAAPWRMARESKGMRVYVFDGLKSDTSYGILVKAFKGTTLVGQYPAYKGCLTVRTKAPDPVAPTVTSRALKLISTSYYTISIKWEPATDNATKKEKIRYRVWIKPYNAPENAWQKVEERKGISSFTFENLDINTKYAYYVEAIDEAGNCLRYPKDNGYSTGSTSADTTAPYVKDRTIKVTETTHNSISIQWTPASDNVTQQSKVRYEMWLSSPYETWHKVVEKAGISSYTFNNLREATTYGIYVLAFDEAGNSLRYPSSGGSLSASTLDITAPTVYDRKLEISNIRDSCFTANWYTAGDNVTPTSRLRYEVYLREGGSWKLKANSFAISHFTFTGLTPNTEYAVYVKAIDEAGNSITYPGEGKYVSVRTIVKQISKLTVHVKQNASVCLGTNCICLELTYTAVRYNANGVLVESQPGSWKHKWSNKDSASKVITLPQNW